METMPTKDPTYDTVDYALPGFLQIRYQHFRGLYCIHLQGTQVSHARKEQPDNEKWGQVPMAACNSI
jgi:hypothetical protein